MNRFRLIWLYLRLGIMNELQYRVNFFVQLVQSIIALATGLIVLSLVFTHTNNLNTWTEPELLIVMGVHILMGGVIKMSIQPNMLRLMEDIHQGTLDYILTKPENTQLLISIRELQFWQAVDVIIGLIIIGFGIVLLSSSIGLIDVFIFLMAIFLGIIILYSFWLIIAALSFWFIRLQDIVTIFQTMYQAGRWPVGIYPSWLRIILTFVVPVAFAVTVPAEAITTRLTFPTMVFAVILAVAIFSISHWVWLTGLRNYSGASA